MGVLQEDKKAELSAWHVGPKLDKEPRPVSGMVDIAGSLFLFPFGGIFLTRILTLRRATLKVKRSERCKGRSLERGMMSGRVFIPISNHLAAFDGGVSVLFTLRDEVCSTRILILRCATELNSM